MKLDDFTKEMIDENSFIDMSHIYLEEVGKVTHLYDIVDKFKDIGGYTEKEIENRILQFYTDLNTDGRFVSTGDGVWGLRKWFSVDDINEKIAPTVHKFDVVDDDDYLEDDRDYDIEKLEDEVDSEEAVEDDEDAADIDSVIDNEDINTKDLNYDDGDTLEDNYDDSDDY